MKLNGTKLPDPIMIIRQRNKDGRMITAAYNFVRLVAVCLDNQTESQTSDASR